MSTKYKATTTGDAYFITITSVGWIDVFTRLNQKQAITEALRYCQIIKAWRFCLLYNAQPYTFALQGNSWVCTIG